MSVMLQAFYWDSPAREDKRIRTSVRPMQRGTRSFRRRRVASLYMFRCEPSTPGRQPASLHPAHHHSTEIFEFCPLQLFAVCSPFVPGYMGIL